ncbi:hypothetical protein Xen7305DRAFT_00039470 [Xenococcus sp. PCC 7305]|uniref:hypothetical protein n=1 Tax=Xenococcus sp. PCC 7305 TaxID=102125 RepID=UPI0002ACDC5A|nr:hypothetical protein [Xenococcus sp. PCC 7305]ELS04219.1 hypothetical protein Xen7305DRAFT_00039470 [Xenococcus sp. PCC 7305]
MIENLYVPKSYGTYSDTCLMLGLACLAEYALGATEQKQRIQLIDEGIYYQIHLNTTMDLSKIEAVTYFDLFPIVVGAKTDTKKIPEEVGYFRTVENSQARSLYKNWRIETKGKEKWREDAPDPPDRRTQNGTILTSMRHDRNHNGLWEGAWNLREHFGDLVSTILEVFSNHNILVQGSAVDTIAKRFKQRTNAKLPTQASAVKIYMPSSIQGVNRILADGIGSSSQKDSWLNLWLIAKGLFDFALSERVKVAENTFDWRVVVLEPKDISLSHYRSVLSDLKKLNPPGSGYGIARFDAELVLRFSQEMLNLSCQTGRKPKLVNKFKGSHFGSKGQVYGLKDVFSLGLPDWMKVSSNEIRKAITFHKVLAEHLSVVKSLDEKHTEILAAYRDFITGSQLKLFFPFQLLYADYCAKRIAKEEYARLFSRTGLDIMIKSLLSSNNEPKENQETINIENVIYDEGFERIAKAINYATVRAGQILVKKEKDGQPYPKKDFEFKRFYGLAQRLGSRTSSREEFLGELAAFITEYKSEYLRLKNKLGKGEIMILSDVNVTDLDRVTELILNWGTNSSLIPNLLIAYGHCYWDRKNNRSTDDNRDR